MSSEYQDADLTKLIQRRYELVAKYNEAEAELSRIKADMARVGAELFGRGMSLDAAEKLGMHPLRLIPEPVLW